MSNQVLLDRISREACRVAAGLHARGHCPANDWNSRRRSSSASSTKGHRRHVPVSGYRVSFPPIRIIAVKMTAIFSYLSPKAVETMSRMDHTIIAVHEDKPESPTMNATETMIADVHTQTDSNQRTKNQFRPRVGKGGATSYQLRQYAEVTLGGGSLRKVVKLPEGEDENEWLAVNSEWRLTREGDECDERLTVCSGGFLQPDQLAVRSDYRILLSTVLPRDEGYRRVRELLNFQEEPDLLTGL